MFCLQIPASSDMIGQNKYKAEKKLNTPITQIEAALLSDYHRINLNVNPLCVTA